MVYEIVLTTSCTRQCDFCWVQKSQFFESSTNIQKFIQSIKDSETEKFKISIFGGEPLLNPKGIKQIVDGFKDCKLCENVFITTNADCFEMVSDQKWIHEVSWIISSYDFISCPEKYKNLARILGPSLKQIQYTFSENDINQTRCFQEYARSIDDQLKYKIAFSHSKNSWTRSDASYVYAKVFDAIISEFNLAIDDFPKFRAISIVNLLKSILGGSGIVSGYQRKCSCLDQDSNQKMVFYDGKFIDFPCLLLNQRPYVVDVAKKNLYSNHCLDCEYFKICNQSCLGEIGNDGKVDFKLCQIEKAKFDATCFFIRSHKYNRILRELIKEYI